MNVKKVARTVFMVILFTLIIISFAFWGLNRNMLTGVQSGVVLAAGWRHCSYSVPLPQLG